MGAQIEGESYMPGYHAMRDLNVEASSSWSPYYEEKTSSHLCNGFVSNPANGYSEYDKEMLKHTMLEHEAIFRQQVYELHRVYKIQKELMNEYQNKLLYTYSMAADASQSNSFSSPMPPDGTKRVWQAPVKDTTYGKVPTAVPNGVNPPFKFLREGSVQSSPNGVPSSDVVQKCRKNMFDLQLPADSYIANENGERSAKKTAANSSYKPIDFLGITTNTNPRNDAKPTLCTREGPRRHRENNSFSDLQTENKQIGRQVADLNELITGMYFGGTTASASRGLVDPTAYILENSGYHLSTKSNKSLFVSRGDYSRDRHADEGTSSNFFDANVKLRHNNSILDKEHGKSANGINFFPPKFCEAELQKSFKVVDMKPSRDNLILLPDQNSTVEWFPQRPMETPGINNFARFDYSRHSSLPLTASFTTRVDRPSVASPSISCSVNAKSSIKHASAAFQPFPSFNASSTMNSYTSSNVATQSIGCSSQKFEGTENSNGFHPGFPLDSVSASHIRYPGTISSDLDWRISKCRNNFNLNQALPDGLEDGLAAQEERCIDSSEHKGEGSAVGISWLKNKAACDDHMNLKKLGKVFEYSNGLARELENKHGKDVGPSLRNLSDSASTSRGYRIQKDQASEDASTRILGFPVCNKTQESATCLPASCNEHIRSDSLAVEGTTEKSSVLVRNLIDLNNEMPNDDNSESSVLSHECHVASLRNGRTKAAFEIDLEAPICEAEGKLDDPQERESADDPFATAAVAAAKNIVSMSMDTETSSNKADGQLTAPRFDALQYLAELATLNADDCSFKTSSDDRLDSFESLTLKLEETKIDEYWSRPKAPEIKNGEQNISSFLLLTKPRRGQARRRRQRRDFQRDILPGLASLSRRQVTEDLNLLGGLVKASGGTWNVGLARRTGRNCGQKVARRQRRNLAITVDEDIEASPPAKPATAADLEADGRSMIGWGRTTRRCRRTRYQYANAPASLS